VARRQRVSYEEYVRRPEAGRTPQGAAMATQIFVNLAVKDLERSVEFFGKLGYAFDPRFTDDNATCMIVADNIFVMLLVESFFRTFTDKPLCDARCCTEVLVCLSCDSRQAVDELVAKAVAAGATTPRAPKDYGFMYQHGFEDIDGHIWELVWMQPDGAPED
jgi:uncharacterized protein